MSKQLYLIKVGEIILKKGNRKDFEERLKQNLLRKVRSTDATIKIRHGRYYLLVSQEFCSDVEEAMRTTFGITHFYKTQECAKDFEEIIPLLIEEVKTNLKKGSFSTFRLQVRRIDKSFPLNSQQISRQLGGVILENFPDLRVNLGEPDIAFSLELREKAYLYSIGEKGVSGLPVGCAGSGLLMLSGGIDSPVAGLMMAQRGMRIKAVHFHTMPFTSEEALEKVRELAKLMSPYTEGIELIEIQFLPLQQEIKKAVDPKSVTLHSRGVMVEIASLIAEREENECLISGEALSQVASQTVGNLNFTNARSHCIVFRPLCGMEKQSIIQLAREFGTYEKSIEPHTDCCLLFAPKHPVLRPKREREEVSYQKISNRVELIESAITEAKRWWITKEKREEISHEGNHDTGSGSHADSCDRNCP